MASKPRIGKGYDRARSATTGAHRERGSHAISISVRLRSVAVGVVGACTLVALPTTVAAKPAFHDKIDETFTDVDFCGVIGTLHVTGTQVITFGDTSFKATGQVTQVFTTADGRTATIQAAGSFTDTFTDNGDDTITFTTTYKGLPEKISSRGRGGVTVRDAGIISFIATFNTVTGDSTFEIVQHGPHPEADSDFTLFCDAFLAALG